MLQHSPTIISAFCVVFIDEVPEAFNHTTRGLCTAAADSLLILNWQIAVTGVRGVPHGGEKRLNFSSWHSALTNATSFASSPCPNGTMRMPSRQLYECPHLPQIWVFLLVYR